MRQDLVLDLLLKAMAEVVDRRAAADRVLERVLKQGLDREERAFIAPRLLGIACLRGRLDYLLAKYSSGWLAQPHRYRLAAWALTEEGASLEAALRLSGLTDGAPLARLAQGQFEWPKGAADRLCAEKSVPLWLARLWVEQFGDESFELADAMNRPGPIVVRANTLKGGREALLSELARSGVKASPSELSPWGVRLEGRPNIFGSPAWRAGLFEVQDEGSQLIALLAGPRPGERCIDFCAGAGGKTLALAAQMEDRGEVVALDVDAKRLADLKPRVERAGVRSVLSREIQPEGPLPSETSSADVVLVDAPCSALGTLRRGPDARWRVAARALASFPGLQRSILERAAPCVNAGGRLVYATCTLCRAENEGVAEGFEAAHPEFRPIPIEERLGEPLARRLGADKRLLLLPNRHGTDGFFACAWQRA